MFLSLNKLVFLFLICFLFSTTLLAQQSAVTEAEVDIKGIPRKGQRIFIQLDSKVVEKAWENHLRDKAGKIMPNINFSKIKDSKGISILEKAKIDTLSKTPIRIFSKVEPNQEATAVWWSVDLGNAYLSKEGTPSQYTIAEAFLKEFARKVYRDDIMRQVAEAEKVLKQSQDEEARVIKQADDLKRNLERNAARKLELEAELSRNAKEKEQFTADIENNRKEQEAAKQEVANMKRAVEVVKAKVNTLE